jgi:PAS domain S-box-containing protein
MGELKAPLQPVGARKRADAPEESDQLIGLLEATLDSTAEGILVVDAQGKILRYNRRFIEMWRMPESVVHSGDDQKAVEFVLDQLKDPGSFVKKVMDVYAQPAEGSFDLLEFKDGRIFERRSRPQQLAGGRWLRVWSFRDVTERWMADEEIQRTLSLLRSTLDATADGILVVDRKGQVVTFNERFVEMWRVPRFILNARDARQGLAAVLEHLKNPGRFERKVRDVAGRPEAQSFDWIEFKDGRILEGYSRPQMKGKQVVGRVWSFRDATDRSLALERLQRLSALLEDVREALLVTDLHGRVLEAYGGVGDFFGKASADLAGCNVEELFEEDEELQLAGVVKSARRDGRWLGPLRARRQGACRDADSMVRVHYDSHSRPSALLWLHRAPGSAG